MIDWNDYIDKEVEVSWAKNGPWHKKFLVAYLPDAVRPFFCVKSLARGYAPSAWNFCRIVGDTDVVSRAISPASSNAEDLSHIADELAACPRQGTEDDDPEGSRYVEMSDSYLLKLEDRIRILAISSRQIAEAGIETEKLREQLRRQEQHELELQQKNYKEMWIE